MVDRFLRVYPKVLQIPCQQLKAVGIRNVLMDTKDHAAVADLEKLNNVTKELQDDCVALAAIRGIFDHVSASFPAMKERLVPDASLVTYLSCYESPQERAAMLSRILREPKHHRADKLLWLGGTKMLAWRCIHLFSWPKHNLIKGNWGCTVGRTVIVLRTGDQHVQFPGPC
jgi:hypothetical protein